ncbi:MAG TPA: Ig-like domain-containing protein [Gemmatimonadaceae bacterium]
MHHVRVLTSWLSSVMTATLVGLVALSCGGSGGDTTSPPPPVAVASVELTPATNSLQLGQTVQLTPALKDASGNVLTGRSVTWGSSASGTVSVSTSGLATAVDTGSATIFATSEGKSGTATFTVRLVPVNALTLTPPTSTLLVAQTVQLSAATTDSAGHTLTGRAIAWSSTLPAVATVSGSGLVSAVAVGTTNVVATSETKADTAVITVQTCASTLQLALGEIHTLTTAEKASLCVTGGASATEYAIVPFNNSTVAASTTPVHLGATNTIAVLAPLASRQGPIVGGLGRSSGPLAGKSMEGAFRARERRDLSPRIASLRRIQPGSHGPLTSYLTGVTPTPTVGTVVQLNSDLSGNTCDPKVLHPARVVAVLPHTLVFADTLSPAGGYSDLEMTGFGEAFDTLGFALDTLNFGAPTDIDGNGRVAIFFTPGVNAIPGPPGGYVLGLQAARDLFAATSCAGSNEGEMFYMPVPDPGSTINGNYTNKAVLSKTVLSTLVHEFQHLINAGRRIYVNGASSLEEVWLNEGLSHIAEELLYYRISGNTPKSNIGLALVQSTQAQLDAANTYQLQNFLRLQSYMVAPESNSPYAQIDGLQMRGAIWELLRYSQDRTGGTERGAWYPLVNTTLTGQSNFNAVFGSITAMAHDWSIAQLTDDAGLTVNANYTNPSWNFRTMMPPLSGGSFPLLTHSLTATPVDVTLNGGSAAYVRFRVPSSTTAIVIATSSGAAVPANVDLTIVRTQ